MDRAGLERWIYEHYRVAPDFPWRDHPRYAVFRHSGNRKWFALVMGLPRSQLGLAGDGRLEIVNLKCDPLLIGSLRGEPGFFSAYHMNRERWISAALDGSVPDETLGMLLAQSYAATAPKARR